MKLTVFEASNSSRREVFVGTTSRAMSALIASFRDGFPRRFRRWSPRDAVRYRSLEFGLSRAQAAACVRNYAVTREGWRLLKPRRSGGGARKGR